MTYRSFVPILMLVSWAAGAAAQAQAPDTVWTRTYGTTLEDIGYGVTPLADGGFALVGHSNGLGVNTLDYDICVFLIDEAGVALPWLWYGGDTTDYGFAITQAADGGLVFAGATHSFSVGPYYDLYMKKIGVSPYEFIWGSTNGDENIRSIRQTSDGGYVAVGFTEALGAEPNDVLLLKIDAAGQLKWSKTFGNDQIQMGYDVQLTVDSGYIMVGLSWSAASWEDVYLIKTDRNGDSLWSRIIGGGWTDVGYSVKQTRDGGYIIVGYTDSYAVPGERDLYLIKTDAQGDTVWTRVVHGNLADHGRYVQEAPDGYVIIGYTRSFGAGYEDLWVLKTDFNGDTLWTKTIGGEYADYAHAGCLTADGGIVVVGLTDSYGVGQSDIYAVRLGPGAGVATHTRNDYDVDQIITHLTPATTTITLTIPGLAAAAGQLVGVNVLIDSVIHPAVGELTLVLRHDLVADTLIHQAGGVAADVIGLVLTDFAATPVELGVAPFSGMYRPYKPLAAFSGLDPDGDWTLEITDAAAGNDGMIRAWGITVLYDVAAGLEPEEATRPERFELEQNLPNPFNAGTTIRFGIPEPDDVRLVVYNLLGRRVATLVEQRLPAGRYELAWHAAGCPSGVYFYELRWGEVSTVRKMLLLK